MMASLGKSRDRKKSEASENSGTHNFGDAQFRGRTISGTHNFGDAQFRGRTISGTHEMTKSEMGQNRRFHSTALIRRIDQ